MNKPVDYIGNEIKLGDVVAKTVLWGRSPALEKRKVVKVEGNSIWVSSDLNAEVGSKGTKIRFNDRLINIS